MAWYRYIDRLEKVTKPDYKVKPYIDFLNKNEKDVYSAFDEEYTNGQAVTHYGIYRCKLCGFEIVVNSDSSKFPPRQDDQHDCPEIEVRWQLVVASNRSL